MSRDVRRHSSLRVILKSGVEVPIQSRSGFTVLSSDGTIVEPDTPNAVVPYLDPSTVAMIVSDGQEEAQSICPHPHCIEVLDGNLWACQSHWYALPMHVRETISVAQRGVALRPTGEYQRRFDQAVQKAQDAWASAEQEGSRDVAQ